MSIRQSGPRSMFGEEWWRVDLLGKGVPLGIVKKKSIQ